MTSLGIESATPHPNKSEDAPIMSCRQRRRTGDMGIGRVSISFPYPTHTLLQGYARGGLGAWFVNLDGNIYVVDDIGIMEKRNGPGGVGGVGYTGISSLCEL